MLPDRWYPILESKKLRRRPVGLDRLGRRIVVWRDAEGRALAAPAACPHRGGALDRGRVDRGELVCPWHGFHFSSSGACTAMPCEGPDAVAPRALGLDVLPVREAHGLVWIFHSMALDPARDSLPPIPWFEEELGDDLRRSAEASYEMPYHYTRMVETSLDIHHVPFVHGSVIPTGQQLDPFEARIDGDRIRTEGELRRRGRSSGFLFRADLQLPGLLFLRFAKNLCIAVAVTPAQADTSWMWFRYYFEPGPAWLGGLVSWIAVQSELRVVQRQDWRVFETMTPGTIDDFPYHFVRADQGIALYRRRRAEILAEAKSGAARASKLDGPALAVHG